MTTRTISSISEATNEMVGSFRIKNVLPTRSLKQIDPFLLIHHLQPVVIKSAEGGRIPPHPHAGFEVVTYLLDGEFFHRDSKGHDQVAEAGDVNWMTSGSGITHSEGPTQAFAQKGDGIAQLLQIWINLPAAQKKLPADFRHYAANSFPVIEKDGLRVKLILGEFETSVSPIETFTPMFLYHMKIAAGTQTLIPVNADFTAGAYVLKGGLRSVDHQVKTGELIHFESNGDQLSISAEEDSELIVFGGRPIKEKVVSYGPFVMNSVEEIQEAIGDYQSGKMGELSF